MNRLFIGGSKDGEWIELKEDIPVVEFAKLSDQEYLAGCPGEIYDVEIIQEPVFEKEAYRRLNTPGGIVYAHPYHTTITEVFHKLMAGYCPPNTKLKWVTK